MLRLNQNNNTQGDGNTMMVPPSNVVLVQNSFNQEHPSEALVDVGRLQQQQQQTPVGVQIVQDESSNQEILGNRMRFMQTSQMVLPPEGIMDPNISHGLLEFIRTSGNSNSRNGTSPV